MKPSPGLMWGTATLMVTIVSCCSLVGVSIMPLISGRFYKSSITLFTGLAVGSLLGSAIFSLIPQAFNMHTQTDKAYLWKSLIIFLGIYLFYCSERLMRIYFDRKTRQQEKDRALESRQEHLELKEHAEDVDAKAGVEQDTRKSKKISDEDVPNLRSSLRSTNAIRGNGTSNDHDKGIMTEIELRKDEANDEALPLGSAIQNNFTHSLNQHQHQHHHHHYHGDSLKPHEIITKALKGDQTQPSTMSNMTSPPTPRKVSEIAPVAWMIIIGDGLHNFIDGLSIGAAFTDSIYQGMIICIAVIFEELPHELGDFAVLISSGMTVRQALGFNFLSACTCYIGMIFGIILGDTTQSASYIFALAAGMFFYISLVDMMGELSAAIEECKHSTRESAHLLLMQNIGILSGITIIFSLSLFGPGG